MTTPDDDSAPPEKPAPWAPLDGTPSSPSPSPSPSPVSPIPPTGAPLHPYAAPPGIPVLPKGGSARTGPLPLHPMTLGDILDGAFKLLKANARTVLIVVAVILLPLQFGTAFFLREAFSVGILDMVNDPSVLDAQSETTTDAGQVIAQLFAVALSIMATPFIAGAVSQVVSASYLGTTIGPGAALAAAGRRFWPLFASFVLVHLIEAVGWLLCLLPGLAAMAMYTVVAPAIVVEQLGPIDGMARSWRLVRPRFWPVLGISMLAGVIANIIGQILGFVPVFGAVLVGGSYAWLLVAVGGVLGSIVTAPLVAIVATLLYFDARIRHEGFDLHVIAREMGGGAAPA